MKLTPDNWLSYYKTSVQVFLDGKKIDQPVREADDVAGYAIVFQYDEKGRIKHDGENVLFERLEGKITFKGDRRDEPF